MKPTVMDAAPTSAQMELLAGDKARFTAAELKAARASLTNYLNRHPARSVEDQTTSVLAYLVGYLGGTLISEVAGRRPSVRHAAALYAVHDEFLGGGCSW